MGTEIDGDTRAMRLLLPPLVLGAMLNPLNSTMLSTALTKLTHSFGRDVSDGALLITPLYLTAMIGQPLMGRLADLYSPKRVNYLGLALVLAAVVVGVFAPNFGWLIVSLPQWLEGVQQFSPSRTGLILLPMSLSAAVSSLWVSRRAGPLLTKWLAVVSAIVASLSLFAVHAGSSLIVVIGVSILIGLITGFNPIANQASLNETVPPELSGFSFGLYRTFVYLGAVGSGALLKYIFHKGVTDASFRQIAWFALYSSLIMSILYLPLLFRRLARRGEVGSGVETAS
jgi:MFS family permease